MRCIAPTFRFQKSTHFRWNASILSTARTEITPLHVCSSHSEKLFHPAAVAMCIEVPSPLWPQFWPCSGWSSNPQQGQLYVSSEETEMTVLVLMEGKLCLQMNCSPKNCRNQHSDEKEADSISILTYCFWSIGTLLKGSRAQWEQRDVSRNHNIYPYLQHAERNLLEFLFPVAIYLG